MTYINDATNGVGWQVEEFIPKGMSPKEDFSHVGNWGWARSESFPDVYDTKEDAARALQRRLKGSVKEFRVYERLM